MIIPRSASFGSTGGVSILPFVEQHAASDRFDRPEIGPVLWPVAMPALSRLHPFPAAERTFERWITLGAVCSLHLVLAALLLMPGLSPEPLRRSQERGLALFSLGSEQKAAEQPKRDTRAQAARETAHRSPTPPETLLPELQPPPVEWRRIPYPRQVASRQNANSAASSGATVSTPATPASAPDGGGVASAAAASGPFDPYAGAAPDWRRPDGARQPGQAMGDVGPAGRDDALDQMVVQAVTREIQSRFPQLRGTSHVMASVDAAGAVIEIRAIMPPVPEPAFSTIRRALLGKRVYVGPVRTGLEIALPLAL